MYFSILKEQRNLSIIKFDNMASLNYKLSYFDNYIHEFHMQIFTCRYNNIIGYGYIDHCYLLKNSLKKGFIIKKIKSININL